MTHLTSEDDGIRECQGRFGQGVQTSPPF